MGAFLYAAFTAILSVALTSSLATYTSKVTELKSKEEISRTEKNWDPWEPITDFERYQWYKQTYAQCADFAQKNHDSFEKTLIALCGGAFGISLTLVGQLRNGGVVWPALLPISWFCFAIGLCLMVGLSQS